MKKKWRLEVSQNCWKYAGLVTITASTCTKVGEKTIIADGVLIEFDEDIGTIETQNTKTNR